MKTSKIFTIAKEYLDDGSKDHNKTVYICYALERAQRNLRITARDKNRTTKIISNLLGEDNGTFGIWLQRAHGIRWYDHYDGCRKLQITRYAWLDHLIKHYESLGD